MSRGAPRNGPRTKRTGTRRPASSELYAPAPATAPFDLEVLRVLCQRQGVTPEDADLERVRGFLDVILPALEALEDGMPEDVVPAP